jgi:acetyl esterase/lipase
MNTICDSSQYYTVQHPDEFEIDWKSFYDWADASTALARQSLQATLDVAYGDEPKQRLDVYAHRTPLKNCPVLVFLHGGGMVEGDRCHYGYVAKPFAEAGVVTVVASYRLAPDAQYPSQPQDIKQVVEWVFHNVRRHGGDPERICVCGHSAGAHLAAFISLDTRWTEEKSLPHDCIKSCVLISGNYDFVRFKNPSYLPGPELAREASPLHNINQPVQRALVAIGSLEDWVDVSAELVGRLRDSEVESDLLVLEEMDHDETVMTLGAESELFHRVLNLWSAA